MIEQIIQRIHMAMEENGLAEIKNEDKEDIMNTTYEFILIYMGEFLPRCKNRVFM